MSAVVSSREAYGPVLSVNGIPRVREREAPRILDPKQARLVSVVRCLHLAPMEGFLAGEGRAET